MLSLLTRSCGLALFQLGNATCPDHCKLTVEFFCFNDGLKLGKHSGYVAIVHDDRVALPSSLIG